MARNKYQIVTKFVSGEADSVIGLPKGTTKKKAEQIVAELIGINSAHSPQVASSITLETA